MWRTPKDPSYKNTKTYIFISSRQASNHDLAWLQVRMWSRRKHACAENAHSYSSWKAPVTFVDATRRTKYFVRIDGMSRKFRKTESRYQNQFLQLQRTRTKTYSVKYRLSSNLLLEWMEQLFFFRDQMEKCWMGSWLLK